MKSQPNRKIYLPSDVLIPSRTALTLFNTFAICEICAVVAVPNDWIVAETEELSPKVKVSFEPAKAMDSF